MQKLSRATLLIAIFTIFFASGHITATPSYAAHGISIDSNLKYGPDFSRFDYTSEKAAKGGKVILHGLGSFDKMNPFTLKGSAPDGLETLVFESLCVQSLDEPFAEYGLLAEDIKLADDGMSVTFTLRSEAEFANGDPVTAEDVKYSLDTLKGPKAHPFYAAYYKDIEEAEILGERKIRFHFIKPNRELHLIAGQMPVFPKEYYKRHGWGSRGLNPPMGSGPYVISDFKEGKSITYSRNSDYWGKDLACRQGMFNFNTITFKYFRDQIVSVEAFKSHAFDFMPINIAKQWARDLNGEKFDRGLIKKEYFPHKNNAGMQGLVFNTRNPLFQDRRVRRALNLAFNFQKINKTLFFDQYTQTDSYFSNSELAAQGVPTGLELEYLEPFRDQLPPEVFTTPPTPVKGGSPIQVRKNLRKAQKLLREAGWKVQDSVLTNSKGRRFQFEILLSSSSFERVMADYVENLEVLGIKADYRTIDPALYSRRMQTFDFDMTVNVFSQSQNPGNEQRNYWGSEAADRQGSRNLIGIKNPVVDKLIDRIIYADNRKELRAACHALDRVLWYNYYVVPNWYLGKHRITYWDKFGQPDTLPVYYQPLQLLLTWWVK